MVSWFLIGSQLLYVYTSRDLTHHIFRKSFFSNIWIHAGIGTCGVMAAAMMLPGVRTVFAIENLSKDDIELTASSIAAFLLLHEGTKFIHRTVPKVIRAVKSMISTVHSKWTAIIGHGKNQSGQDHASETYPLLA